MSSTVCSQTISRDSLCFSKEQSIKIMKDLKKGYICDSINNIMSLQIIEFRIIIINNNEIITISNEKNEELKKSLNYTNKKLKIMSKISKLGIPTAIVAGVIIGIAVN